MVIATLLLAATTSSFDQVVAAERGFAAASLETGFHESFLAYLAPDAIEFRPAPQPARPSHEGKPHAAVELTWGPSWVAVSSAGDLALSTGPFEMRSTGPSARRKTPGLFVSVWRRQADGSWKVAVDAGISSPLVFAMPTAVEDGSTQKAAKPAPRPSDAANARLAITTAERAFSAAAKSGVGDAVAKQIEPAARIYREGKPAGLGTGAARTLLAADTRKLTCKPDQIIASTSADLGYAYGSCTGDELGTSKSYGFLHAWRKQADGSWRILVDVTP